MKSFSEQIREGHQENQIRIAQSLMQDTRMYDELRRFLISTRDDVLLRQFYGLDSSRIVPHTVQIILEKVRIILPQEPQIYLGNSREKYGFDLESLSRDELSFLIQAFITDKTERDYIV